MDSLTCRICTNAGTHTGMIRVESSVVILEYRKWSWKALSKALREDQILVREITSVRYISTLFMPGLEIGVTSMKALGDIPQIRPGQLKLQFAFRDRKAAQQMVTALELAVSEAKLARLSQELERLDSRTADTD